MRLNIPALTEERRHDLVRQVHKRMEEARVEIRNLRRDAADQLKKLERDGEVGTDEGHKLLDEPPEAPPTATSPRSTASAPPRSRRSSRSSGACAADPADRRAAPRPRGRAAASSLVRAGRSQSPSSSAPAAEAPDARLDMPRHVAIIMDGNRRWARARGVSEIEGHAAGVEAIREVLRHAVRREIPVLTLYAFSRENWARTDDEVVGLFGLLEERDPERDRRAACAGRPGPAAGPARRAPGGDPGIHRIRARGHVPTASRLILNIAFNYAGRTELVDAVRRIVRAGTAPEGDRRGDGLRGPVHAGLPDPDLVIRTGGEQRLSNFLIWQSAYAELLTTRDPVAGLRAGRPRPALAEYARRTRRFGR